MARGVVNFKKLRRLRLIRLLRGITAEQLAELIYMTNCTIRNYECSNTNLKFEAKKKISKILNVPIKDFDCIISEEEIKEYFKPNGKLNKKWQDIVSGKTDSKGNVLGLSKQHEIEKKLMTSRKPPKKQCLNQACLLNKKLWCQSDQVRLGIGSCDGQYKIKPKKEEVPAVILFGKSY